MLSAIAILSSTFSFANISLGGVPPFPYVPGKDYVGVINAVEYIRTNDGKKQLLIMSQSDDANNDTALPSLAVYFDGDDMPFGLTLAGSIGQKIAVGFSDANYTVGFFEIITDGYWNGTSKVARIKKN